MKITKEFITRKADAFEKDLDDHWDNEDINTMCSKMVFEGISMDIEENDGIITMSNSVSKLFGYDVVKDIHSPCYVRTIEISPGRYQESWRTPNLPELESFISVLKDVYEDAGYKHNISDDRIYQWYIMRKRELKIDTIIE